MARRRQRFELPAKTVHIHRIDLRSYQYPELELDIECGGGTYIRSIARDLGEELGCGGLLSELERTRIGPWSVQEAVSADEVDEDNLQRFLLPASTALDELPRYECTADDLARLRNGRSIRPAQKPGEWSDGSRVALIDAEGELAGLAELSGVALQPRQVYLTRVT